MQKIKRVYLDNNKKKKLLLLCGSFFLAIIALISLASFSLAALTPTESIEILSENLNYENKQQGSWKIKKSATWLSKGKIKVSYDIRTKSKVKAKNIDLLLVVNTSNSLSDEQFSTMKNSLNEFTDGILTDGSSSRMALLSFNSDYSIISDFSNDKNTIISGINNLTMGTGSSYYKGFLGIDEVLNNYRTTGNNKLVVIFVTSSLPNKDIPNENAKYNYLKVKYSNLIINAVTYDMSSSVPDKVKNISDNQFIASGDNLSDILFNASDVQYSYEKFTIDDYIDTNNFNVENLDSLKISYGSASLESDSTGKKIAINLDNLVSGNKVNISYEMNLINNSDADRIFAVNKSIKINSSLVESVEDILSEKTPVLVDDYKVSYISNAPSGCSITIPSAKNYSVFDTIKINDDLVCDGYQFRGWELVSDKDVTMINDDVFLMPESDVVIKGTWSKLSITKSMDGTVYTPQTLNDIIENQAVLDNTSSEFVTSETGIDFSNSASNTNGKGVYTMASTKNDEFPIHYYRGDVSNNYVKYAGFCWKIVRTTETGGVKLIYYGKPDNSTGACSSSSSILLTAFNKDGSSITDAGYMWGDRYETSSKEMLRWYGLAGKSISYKSLSWYEVLGRTTKVATGIASSFWDSNSSTYYYYGTDVTYSSGTYKLSGTVKQLKAPQTTLGTSLSGKYTCFSTVNSSCTSVGYITYSPLAGLGLNKGSFNYVSMTGGETYDSLVEEAKNVVWLYSDDVTYADGQYTLTTNVTEYKPYPAQKERLGKYTCHSSSDTCTSVKYIDKIYAYGDDYVAMNDGETYESLYASATVDEYTYMYGNDVSYDESSDMYTLIDPISSHIAEFETDYDNLSGHHYFCLNNQESCQTVYYINDSVFDKVNPQIYYMSFTSGTTIDDVYNSLNSNINNSTVKTEIDGWYQKKLIKYKDYLEDTVYCNDRQLRELGFFDKDSKLADLALFNTEYRLDNNIPSLECSSINDSFSTTDTIGNGKLTYPIGLLTSDELIFASSMLTTAYSDNGFTMSPDSFAHKVSMHMGIRSFTLLTSQAEEIYPVVSLKNGLMVYSGNGSSTNPYVLESLAKKIVIEGNEDIKVSQGAALPGETIELISKSGTSMVISFSLNGETILGSSFIMPDGDVLINDIAVLKVVIEGNDDIEASPIVAAAGETINLVSKSGVYKVISFDLNGETISGSSFAMPNGIALVNNIVAIRIIIEGNDDIKASPYAASPGETVNLISESGLSKIISFDLNGQTISGSSFTMPSADAVVTNIVVIKSVLIESEHNPYPGSLNSKVYGEYTFEGATSLTVNITYQTQGTGYDWIYIYNSSGSTVGGKLGGTTKTTKTLTVSGNYIKITFRTNSSSNNYYGFYAKVTPNYD